MFEPESEKAKFWLFVALFLAAIVGRYLKQTEQINPIHFAGEVLVACALCGVSYFFGLMQSWHYNEIIVYGVGGALGHIQIFKLVVQQASKRG